MAGKRNAGPSPPDHLFALGRVLGFWGNRGMVKVYPLTDFPERVADKEEVWLWREDTGARRAHIREGRTKGRLLLLGFEGVETISQAEDLRGSLVMVDEEHLEKLPAGSWWHHDLLGMAVRDEEGRPLGTLAEIVPTGAADVFVIRDGERELLVPAAREFIREVDTGRREMVVRVPPGEGPKTR